MRKRGPPRPCRGAGMPGWHRGSRLNPAGEVVRAVSGIAVKEPLRPRGGRRGGMGRTVLSDAEPLIARGDREDGFVTEENASASAGLPLRMARKEIKPFERLVPVSFRRCRPSTPGLSTWWSTTALQGMLVLRRVSRLDAFSGYPGRT